MSQQPGFAGWVTEVKSHSLVTAHVFVAGGSGIVRYGAFALIEDDSVSPPRRYLGMVVDVRESLSLAAVDPQALQRLLQNLATSQAQYQSLSSVLRNLIGTGIVRSYGVRTVDIRLLGQVDAQSNRLVLPEEPPRPSSLVKEPDPGLLQAIIAGGLGARGLRLGSLIYNPGVEAVLDPDALRMHMAVLGQTGSGKSETVKRLVAEYVWRKSLFGPRGGVIVFDVAGEYTGYPYRGAPGTVPLLDAVLEPTAFPEAGEIVKLLEEKGLSPWHAEAPKTILVPFDLSTLPVRGGVRAETEYAQRIRRLVEELANRYPGVDVRGLVYARHHVYAVEPGAAPRPVSRPEAAKLLESRDTLLVVAAPLPDTLTVGQIVELSTSRSEYFEQAVLEFLDTLGLLDMETVASVSALTVLAETLRSLYSRARRGQTGSGSRIGNIAASTATSFRDVITRLVGLIHNGTRPGDAARQALGQAGVDVYESRVRALLNLVALPLLGDPRVDPYDAATAQAALQQGYPVSGQQWGSYLEANAYSAALDLVGYDARTVYSVLRGLQRVERLVSPWLDAGQYRLLAERLVEGFSIVHLAEPSQGDVDLAVARLLDEAFAVSRTVYSPERRTLIVVEEAHNLAPAGEEKDSKRALLRIAREGRKWGLSLVLVSQRPGFIDQGILSQASSLVALRITNPDDLSTIRRSVESTSQEIVERLPDLEQGQAVVSGPVVPERRIPLFVKVRRLERPGQP